MPDVGRQLDMIEQALRSFSGPDSDLRHLQGATEIARAINALVNCPSKASVAERSRRLQEVLDRIGMSPRAFALADECYAAFNARHFSGISVDTGGHFG